MTRLAYPAVYRHCKFCHQIRTPVSRTDSSPFIVVQTSNQPGVCNDSCSAHYEVYTTAGVDCPALRAKRNRVILGAAPG